VTEKEIIAKLRNETALGRLSLIEVQRIFAMLRDCGGLENIATGE
jgi:hypothetical protein